MICSLVQLLRCLLPELLVAVTGLTLVAGLEADRGSTPLVLALATAAITAGLAVLHRSGELLFTWRCPRLARLAVRTGSLDAPWSVLVEAESALRTLDGDGRRFREFFVEARPWLRDAARRAIASHAHALRFAAALASAPAGEGRRRLEAESRRSHEELARIGSALAELRARLVASTAPLSEVADPMPALTQLQSQTAALADALAEVDARPGLRHSTSRRGAAR